MEKLCVPFLLLLMYNLHLLTTCIHFDFKSVKKIHCYIINIRW